MFKSVGLFTKFLPLLFFVSLFAFGTRDVIYGQESASVIATVSISICGNGEVEKGEVCDTKSLNDLTCKDFGYEYGELGCCLSCDEYDFSNCFNTVEEIEEDAESISYDDTNEKAVINTEEIKGVLMKEVNLEEVVSPSQESSSKNDDEDMLPPVDNDVLISDIVLGENMFPENSGPVIKGYDVIQNTISRSPP